MALVPGDVARYGGVIVDANDRVIGFQPRSSPRAAPVHRTAPGAPGAPVAPVLHFIGVQAVESRAFDGVPDDRPSETIRTLYPQLLARQGDAIAAFRSNATFLDVGTPRDYFMTVARVARAEGVVFDRGEHVLVAPDSAVSDTILWDNVTIAPGARLYRCVVADGVFVGSGRYEEQVLVATPEGMTSVTPL
jgi:NDP-sugar pyrophosphorylase family protein